MYLSLGGGAGGVVMLHIVHTIYIYIYKTTQGGMLPRQRHCTREMCEQFWGGGGG